MENLILIFRVIIEQKRKKTFIIATNYSEIMRIESIDFFLCRLSFAVEFKYVNEYNKINEAICFMRNLDILGNFSFDCSLMKMVFRCYLIERVFAVISLVIQQKMLSSILNKYIYFLTFIVFWENLPFSKMFLVGMIRKAGLMQLGKLLINFEQLELPLKVFFIE